MAERYMLVRLRRGRKRAILIAPGGRLFRDRTESDAAVQWALAQGWREADITYLDDDPQWAKYGWMFVTAPATSAPEELRG